MPNPNNAHGFIAEFCFGSNAIPLWYGTLKSAQTVTEGDVLKATGGLVMKFATVVTDDPKIVGVCAETKVAPSTARDTVIFAPAIESIVFSGQYATGAVFSQGIIWTARGLGRYSTGKMRLSATVSSVACIIGLKRTSAFGSFGEALFIFGSSRMSGRGIY
jgi:hypothetical protein